MSTEQERNSRMWAGYSRTKSDRWLEEYFSRGRQMRFLTVNGLPMERTKFGETGHFAESYDCCPDCGAQPGMTHVPPCEMERCPNCKNQLLACDCHLAALGQEWEQFEKERQWSYERRHGSGVVRPEPKSLIN